MSHRLPDFAPAFDYSRAGLKQMNIATMLHYSILHTSIVTEDFLIEDLKSLQKRRPNPPSILRPPKRTTEDRSPKATGGQVKVAVFNHGFHGFHRNLKK
jgi:hypothetical protein